MKNFAYRIRIFGLRIYFSNCRLKKRSNIEIRRNSQKVKNALAAVKQRKYRQLNGCCEICGKHLEPDEVQMHHTLPYAEFPQYGTNPANIEMTCEECHQFMHFNPYAKLESMEQAAKAFGFDLREYYENKASKNEKEQQNGNNNE